MRFGRRDFHRLLAASCWPAVNGQTPPENSLLSRRALLIGNGAYSKVGSLRNSLNDARDMSAALRRCHFDTVLETDLAKAGFRASLQRFVNSLSTGDVALFFFAGHGVQIEGENYMLPVDFDPAAGEAQAERDCVRMSELQELIGQSGARMNILVIDACRNNPFRPDSKVKGLALMDAVLGSCIVLSACPGQTAADNPAGRNGLFTRHLLEELSGPPLPIEQTFKRVKDRVFAASAERQRPWLLFDTIGDFLFAQADAPPAPKQLRLDSLIEKGRQEFQIGRYAEAAADFEAALREDQNNPWVCNALGAARMVTNRTSEAVSLFSRAIELKPDYGAAYYNRGLLYYQKSDQYRAAIQDFSWAIEEDPADPRPRDLRGKVYLALSEYEPALADFNFALEQNPSDSAALLGRGTIRFRQRNNPEAIRDLTESIAIRPAAEAFALRSQVYLAAGRRAEAEADRRKADQLQGH